MDPVTAIFVFLCTPPGQTLATELIKANNEFIDIVGDLIKATHSKLQQSRQPPAK